MSDQIDKIKEKMAASYRERESRPQRFNRRFTDQIAINDDSELEKKREEILENLSNIRLNLEDTVLLASQEKDYDIPAYQRRAYGYKGMEYADMTEEEHQYFFDFMKRPLLKDEEV